MKDSSQTKVSFIADENIPVGLINFLLDKGFDVIRVKLRSKDPKIFERAKSEQRVILTRDKDFLNKDKFPPKESFGIIFFNINPPLIDSLQYSLNRLFKSVKFSEPQNSSQIRNFGSRKSEHSEDFLGFKGKLFILSLSGFKVFPRESLKLE